MRSIRGRVIAAVLAVVLAGGVVALVATDRAYRGIIKVTSERSLEAAEEAFESLRQARADVLTAALLSITTSSELRGHFAARDRDALHAASSPRFEALRDDVGLTRWYYYEPGPEGVIFLRVYRGEEALEPGSYGDASLSRTLARARETGELSSGFELGTQALSIRAVLPFEGEDGGLIGFVGLGERVEEYLAVIAAQTGDEYAMFLAKSGLEEDRWREVRELQDKPDNWNDFEDVVLAESTLEDEVLAREAVSVESGVDHMEESHAIGLVTAEGRTYMLGTFPVLDFTGTGVGFVAVFNDVTEITAVFRTIQVFLILGFLAIAVAVSLSVALVLERVVFRRIDGMVEDMEHLTLAVAAGEWDEVRREARGPDDEIGRFETFLGSFLTLVAAALRSGGDEMRDGKRDR